MEARLRHAVHSPAHPPTTPSATIVDGPIVEGGAYIFVSSLDMYKLPTLQPIDAVTLSQKKSYG